MDPRRSSTFNPTADVFTPTSSALNRSFSNYPVEMPLMAVLPEHHTSEGNTYQQGNKYQTEQHIPSRGLTQQLTPDVQVIVEELSMAFVHHPHSVAPMAPPFHRPVEQYSSYQKLTQSVPENRRLLQNANFQVKSPL
ncbi:hypothetical protein EYC84_001407 [Monilinia fructicola]|uniref:Uncharacterized protein n=1 Tax=Monilinia fructicola TaxID=38448 RepID=A0A5M9JPJ3_MONFR|nr:hypothetical protein EYC84_001407 [Monilinia fructicola]